MIHHINLLERVQRSFTKRIPGCSHLSYIERLLHLNLHTLEQRRLFADLIMCYNIVKGNNCIDPSTFFSFPNYKFSCGHPLKIFIPLAKLNARKFFFFLCKSCHPCLELFARNNCDGFIHIQFQTPLAPNRFLEISYFPSCY